MTDRHRASKPKSLKSISLDDLCPEFAERLTRIMAAPGAKGWDRLCELLHFAQQDSLIQSSPGASAFLELMHDLANNSFRAKAGETTGSENKPPVKSKRVAHAKSK